MNMKVYGLQVEMLNHESSEIMLPILSGFFFLLLSASLPDRELGLLGPRMGGS